MRRKMLSELRTHLEPATLVRELLENYQDGRIKMWITMRTLELRREYASLFHKGTYVPLESSDKNSHLCAFARIHEESGRAEVAIIAVPRLAYTLMAGKVEPPISDVWGDATITLAEGIPSELRNVLTDKKVAATDRKLACREIFETLPVAVLVGSN